MGLPAARVTDLHVCPIPTHVGGPIIPPCKPTVLTGKLPQARVTDRATCVGPPDVVATGAWTVLVGGLPAARMTDTTVHGGKIVSGLFTVLIGTAGGGSGGGGGARSVRTASGLSQTSAMLSTAAATVAPNRQAAVYKNAAKAGTPFCERCQR